MKTPKAVEMVLKVDELLKKFENYLRPLIDNWKCTIPQQVREKIKNPLFTINNNKTIGLNFAKEVIIF